MSPLKVSAQFAAFTWFVNQRDNAGKPSEEAHCFARANWERFLPLANEGWGRLLLRLAKPGKKKVKVRSAPDLAEATVAARFVPPPAPPQDTAAFMGYTWVGRDS